MDTLKLSESDERNLINALQVASERYSEHAKNMRDLSSEAGSAQDFGIFFHRLMDLFDRQMSESEALIENLVEILTDMEG